MTPQTSHLEKWRHNRRFLAVIPDEFSDWIVIVAFYAAIHCVEALFEHDKNPPATSHDVRNRILKSTNRYKHIWKHFRPLWDASMGVRYYIGPSVWIDASNAKVVFVQRHLYEVEKSAFKLQGKATPEPVDWSR